MDTTTAHNQPQIETFESKLITIQGTSSLPTEHVYRIRKTLHPQTTANQFQLNKTLNTSDNSVNQYCHLCNKNTSRITAKYCACQDKQYHSLCLFTHILQEYKQGNGIMQCAYCNQYYSTVIEINYSLQNLSRKQKLVYASAFLILLILIIVEVTVMITTSLNLPFYLFLVILILIELLLFLRLMRSTILLARIVRFSFKEYRFSDENIQSFYAKNSFKIISAVKYNKAEQLFIE